MTMRKVKEGRNKNKEVISEETMFVVYIWGGGWMEYGFGDLLISKFRFIIESCIIIYTKNLYMAVYLSFRFSFCFQ